MFIKLYVVSNVLQAITIISNLGFLRISLEKFDREKLFRTIGFIRKSTKTGV